MSDSPKNEPVTARILFSGVMIACINKNGQYEVGMVVCPEHSPTIKVSHSDNGGPASGQTEIPWPAGDDLIFKVYNPIADGVSIHPNTDQDTSFHRVLDMEGFLLHRGRVTVNPGPLQGRRLAVTAGQLYTHELSEEKYDLLTWENPGDPGVLRGHIGQIARKVGLNVLCSSGEGSGIQLLNHNTGDEIYSMPAVNGRSYEVEIDNDCTRSSGSPAQIGTDFRYFYDQGFVTSPDGFKFDLGYTASTSAPVPSPDVCENTFLSLTDTLGM
jgi:hypothetical protein